MAVSYNKNTDYKALMDAAIAAGDYKAAAGYEQQRNAKIAGEGITEYKQTYDLGSVYDAQHMTNSELGRAYNSRLAYQSGQTDMSSSHDYVENLRKNYGYSGGSDGSQYIPIEQPRQYTRQEYEPPQTFTYSYSPPVYTNRYQSLIDELSGRIMQQDPFSYDPESDPLYQQYRTGYTRGGQRAMQDAMGQMAARTGGMASSYAQSVAQQTYDGYMSALADKIPELQQLAYEMYQDEGDKQRLNLQMIAALEREDYGRYQDLLSQYNTDRSFSYNQYRDELSDLRYADETAYDRNVYAGQTAYDRNQYNEETAYKRGLYEDEADYDRKVKRAKTLAETGDFSGYLELGYSQTEVDRMRSAFLLQHPELRYGLYGSGYGYGSGLYGY